jgi:DNA-binding NtrC family response regulator
MGNATVLVVDDENLIRWALGQRLGDDGHRIVEANDAAQAIKAAEEGVDLILLDNRLPDTDGINLLPRLRKIAPDAPIIMMTAHASVELAVEAMKLGAWHYVRKPLHLDEVAVLVQQGLETRQLRFEVQTLRAVTAQSVGLDQIVGDSVTMQALRSLLGRVARTPATTILLLGESGTGKDLAAKCIHSCSDRASKPFMNITCSALQETLLESELFGHERGAFTDAKQQKKGLLEMANGGTVFLDEVGEMSLGLQSKLLRFLEDKAFKRVGGSQDVRVDVRIIAATNRDLDGEVRAGRFREDLFYRLRVLPITLPPLRERSGDVQQMVEHFSQRFAREFHKPISGISADALATLHSYRWPGNIRELKNAVERAVLLADSDMLRSEDFLMMTPPDAQPQAHVVVLPPGGVDLNAVERDLVVQAIERTAGNQTHAAALLGLTRDQIRYRLEKLGMVGTKVHHAD